MQVEKHQRRWWGLFCGTRAVRLVGMLSIDDSLISVLLCVGFIGIIATDEQDIEGESYAQEANGELMTAFNYYALLVFERPTTPSR